MERKGRNIHKKSSVFDRRQFPNPKRELLLFQTYVSLILIAITLILVFLPGHISGDFRSRLKEGMQAQVPMEAVQAYGEKGWNYVQQWTSKAMQAWTGKGSTTESTGQNEFQTEQEADQTTQDAIETKNQIPPEEILPGN